MADYGAKRLKLEADLLAVVDRFFQEFEEKSSSSMAIDEDYFIAPPVKLPRVFEMPKEEDRNESANIATEDPLDNTMSIPPADFEPDPDSQRQNEPPHNPAYEGSQTNEPHEAYTNSSLITQPTPIVAEPKDAVRQKLRHPSGYDDIFLPPHYHPDLKDVLREDRKRVPACIKDGEFHRIGMSARQAKVIAALKSELIENEDGTATEDPSTMTRVAAKSYDINEMEQLQDPQFRYLCLELALKELNHPNIISVLDVFHMYRQDHILSTVWIVTERMQESLDYYFERLSQNDHTNPTMRKSDTLGQLLLQLIGALEFLERCRLVHRDVTPKNIGINEEEDNITIKLFDFGVAGLTDSRGAQTADARTPKTYMPLEMLIGHRYDSAIDMWCAGLVGLEMLGCRLTQFTKPRWSDDGKPEVIDRIFEIHGEEAARLAFGAEKLKPWLKEDVPDRPSTLAEELKRALNRSDANEDSKKQLLDLFKQLLIIDPHYRPRASDGLQHAYLKEFARKATESSPRKRKCAEKQQLENWLKKYSPPYHVKE